MEAIVRTYNEKLAKVARRASLPQMVRRSLQYLKELHPRFSVETLYDKIRFRGNPSLAFQKKEIASATMVNDENGLHIELTLNFLSIFGSASPLPSCYCELVLRSVDEEKVLSDFLDLFNHHAQRLVFPTWLKHRYYVQYQNDLKDRFSKYMLSILGLYVEYQERSSLLNIHRLLPYIGILSMRARSAGSIRSILRHYLAHDKVEIEQCALNAARIPDWQRAALGSKNSSLSVDCVIGDYVNNRAAKFRVVLRSAMWQTLVDFSYHGKKMDEIDELIEFMLKEPLDYEVALHVEKERVEPLSLSDKNSAYLGVNSVIGLVGRDLEVAFIKRGK